MDPQKVKEIRDFKDLMAMQSLQGELFYHCHRRLDEQDHHLAKVVCTPEEANNIFLEVHASAIGAHCGIEKTTHAVLRWYYWPGMKADITKWVSILTFLYKCYMSLYMHTYIHK